MWPAPVGKSPFITLPDLPDAGLQELAASASLLQTGCGDDGRHRCHWGRGGFSLLE